MREEIPNANIYVHSVYRTIVPFYVFLSSFPLDLTFVDSWAREWQILLNTQKITDQDLHIYLYM